MSVQNQEIKVCSEFASLPAMVVLVGFILFDIYIVNKTNTIESGYEKVVAKTEQYSDKNNELQNRVLKLEYTIESINRNLIEIKELLQKK